MVSAIGTPRRHPESGIYWFRKRVPDRLRARVGRREIKFTLGTRDPAIARIRNLETILQVERSWAEHDVANAGGEAIQSHPKRAGGGRPPTARRSTSPPQPTAAAAPDRALPGLRVVFEAYAAEAELSAATYKRWAPVIAIFATYLGHDDLSRISRADVTGWKDSLLGEGRSTRTVRDVYLASITGRIQGSGRSRLPTIDRFGPPQAAPPDACIQENGYPLGPVRNLHHRATTQARKREQPPAEYR